MKHIFELRVKDEIEGKMKDDPRSYLRSLGSCEKKA